jgi:hypothetical protein
MENPFANRNNGQERQGPFQMPSVSMRGDDMEVNPPADGELRPEEPQRFKVPKSKWW